MTSVQEPGFLERIGGERPRRGRPRNAAPRKTATKTTPFGRAVLTAKMNEMREAAEGTRDDTLLRVGRLIGGYVAGGELEHELARSELRHAALASGLPEAEVDAKLARHLDYGARDPLSAPSTSDGSSGPSGSTGRGGPVTGPVALNAVRDWLARFVCTVDESDLDLLALWAVHTHFIDDVYTTPRLLIDSPVPESGKTTVLEHLERLCLDPVQMASVSSPAMLTRLLDKGMRTILIDEADRSLSPDREGVNDLLAVLNSGYKKGATRPVSVPAGGGWDIAEMPTYAPVALAGNQPNLPDDTRSRVVRVLLVPDREGRAEESDWESIEDDAHAIREQLAAWAEEVSMNVRKNENSLNKLPDSVKGRARERWSPLKRIAVQAGGRWPSVVDTLAVQDVERIALEREDGITQARPHVVLLGDIAEVWRGERFLPTDELIRRLIDHAPHMWGAGSTFGKALTVQRLGRMLATKFNVYSMRLPDGDRARGYSLSALSAAFRGLGVTLPVEPDGPDEPSEPAAQLTLENEGNA